MMNRCRNQTNKMNPTHSKVKTKLLRLCQPPNTALRSKEGEKWHTRTYISDGELSDFDIFVAFINKAMVHSAVMLSWQCSLDRSIYHFLSLVAAFSFRDKVVVINICLLIVFLISFLLNFLIRKGFTFAKINKKKRM
jgi:hypothetical protein